MALAADGAVVCDLLIRFVVKLSSSRAGLGNWVDARCELGKRCRMFFLARVLRLRLGLLGGRSLALYWWRMVLGCAPLRLQACEVRW